MLRLTCCAAAVLLSLGVAPDGVAPHNVAPDDGFIVDAAQLQHRNPITPYDSRRLFGVVRATWLRGERIDLDAEPRGRLLRRGES